MPQRMTSWCSVFIILKDARTRALMQRLLQSIRGGANGR